MYSLLLVAAMANPLWFDNQLQPQGYAITPMVHLETRCQCQLQIQISKSGEQGSTVSRQQSTIIVPAGEDTPLANFRFNLEQGDRVLIHIALTDGQRQHYENSLSLPQ
ncbi:MAG: curli assembly chaperone CsgC [Rouxiella aceris]|uniref:curli assembly chaperone CsgC n=1 Tax=Rouxiella aceris TaxID=2703884 RepID=UPI0028496EA0|nr:curli assembly chaperone CsgC [Rouxiella aceris]MDR3432634.1 curli assembly chaperone CsgC [Rouxiella aceris]